ncbi:primase-helicase family protein [Psychrobacter sp. 72-O-c]|uniref:primase-helicase family protein n=1 Tax=Psychrobacter sp. 72-O-c TaxID=2774125 RepID=UPI0019198D20|nr:primase-helicase family protein [Psychrobacter sp. 72-O-c]
MIPDKQLTDFNDLAAAAGLNEVSRQIKYALEHQTIITDAANDALNPITAPIETDGIIPANIEQDMRLYHMLKRYAQITDIGKVTNKVYDTEQKIEYTKTQFANEIGNKKLADRWWQGKHAKISKAEVSKDRDELMAVEAQSMFDRYFLIYGTKEVWDDAERTRLPVDTIKLARPNEYEIWLKSEQRIMVKAENIWFDPTRRKEPKHPKDIAVNTFDGLPLKPIETTYDDAQLMCKPITDLLLHLCEYDQTVFDWVIRWLAIPLQHPGTKLDTALIFHGEIQGAGKSLFFDRIMSRIYGDYGVTLGQGQLESQYNDWVAGKLYALFEEIFSGSDRYSQMGMVKQLITGNTIYINQKFMSGWQQDNYVNAIFLSNNMMPLSLEQNDRRHVVCYPTKKIPEPLLNEVAKALDDSNDEMIRAFYTLLMKMDLKGQTAHSPALMTGSKRQLIRLSQPNWEVFYDDWVKGDTGIPYCSCLTDDLYDYYQYWSRKNGERGTTKTKLMTYIGRREHKERLRYQLPGGIRPIQSTVIAIRMPSDYPTNGSANQQVWLGQQIQRMKGAIGVKLDPK